MNKFLNGIEWRKVIILLVVFVLSFITLVSSLVLYLITSDKLSSTSQRLSNIEQRTYTAVENGSVFFDSLQTINELGEKGIMGEPLRLEWVKTLQSIVENHKIPSVGFTVNPSALKGFSEFDEGGLSHVLKTPMVLEMELMHEGDFYNLLTDLEDQSKGFFQIDFCDIKRKDKNLKDESNPTKLEASCELTWFNYKDFRKEWLGNDV